MMIQHQRLGGKPLGGNIPLSAAGEDTSTELPFSGQLFFDPSDLRDSKQSAVRLEKIKNVAFKYK